MRGKSRTFVIALALGLLFATAATATTVQQLNLEEMTTSAAYVYRGAVLGVEEGTTSYAGAEIPHVTYTIEVTEAFKGVEVGDVLTLRMVGELDAEPQVDGDLVTFPPFPDMPSFSVGGEYLLLTTAPSPLGLSAPVGLGQGSFEIGGVGLETARNEADNVGLFRGMKVEAPRHGAVPYGLLAREIRRNVNAQ